MTEAKFFFQNKMEKIFLEKKTIIDIGGGLRALRDKGNRYDKYSEWLLPFLEKVDYKILDPISRYKPDIIGDIHDLPFKDNSQDAILCISVLEHVKNPIKACNELYRALKPGGYCFVYIPFLYYYHAEEGYYRDYWRFSKDAVELLFSKFSHIEMCAARGAIETIMRLSPFGRYAFFIIIAQYLDKVFKKNISNQVSGYNIFLIK